MTSGGRLGDVAGMNVNESVGMKRGVPPGTLGKNWLYVFLDGNEKVNSDHVEGGGGLERIVGLDEQ